MFTSDNQLGKANLQFKHGESGTLLHALWKRMIQRCETPTCNDFKYYGARGIKVCQRWKDSFEAFRDDIGPRPPGTSLDRYPDNNGNYEPGNVRWANAKQQSENQKTTLFIEHDGRRMCLNDWDRHLGVSLGSVSSRIKRGMLPIEAVSRPFQKRRKCA